MYEELLYDFDESGLNPRGTVVRCRSQYEADIFLKYLNAKGVWNNKEVTNLSKQWSRHGCSTCYHLSDRRWCWDSWYEENCPAWRIVDFCDIYKNQLEVNVEFSFDELMQDVI